MLDAAAMRTGCNDDPIPLPPDDPLPQALTAMIRHQTWHLPVVLDNQPIGTLYLSDVLTRWPHQATGELPQLIAPSRASVTP